MRETLQQEGRGKVRSEQNQRRDAQFVELKESAKHTSLQRVEEVCKHRGFRELAFFSIDITRVTEYCLKFWDDKAPGSRAFFKSLLGKIECDQQRKRHDGHPERQRKPQDPAAQVTKRLARALEPNEEQSRYDQGARGVFGTVEQALRQ